MWGNINSSGIGSLANSDSDNDGAAYGGYGYTIGNNNAVEFGGGGRGAKGGAGRRAPSFLPSSLLMALNQQSNDVLSSINFERIINNYMENSGGD